MSMDILLFGDQTCSQLPFLWQVAICKDNSIHGAFLTRASSVLRDEVRKLPYDKRQIIPDFLKLSDLLTAYQERKLKIPELESAFLTISQIAWYMK